MSNTTPPEDLPLRIGGDEDDSTPSKNVRFQITSYPAQFTTEGLWLKYQKEPQELIVPTWQRNFVWTLRQASELIDSCLRGLPVPQIFLYREPKTEALLVIDGQQRLRTIVGFYEGIFPSAVKKKHFVLDLPDSPWNGLTYKQLPTKDKRMFENFVLPATIIRQDQPNDDSSIFYIFDRLNTGGTPLQGQEVRNAIYHGPFNDALLRLNREPSWRQIFGSAHPHNRMKDVELILRFFALMDDEDNYEKPMAEFLNGYMHANRRASQSWIDNREECFRQTCSAILDSLGPRPFRFKSVLNVALFEAFAVAVARTGKGIPVQEYTALLSNEDFIDHVTKATSDEASVSGRIRMATEALG